MGKKLYVGNLPFTISDDQLRDHFSQVGNVESAQVIMDRFSGRSKGFGFVEMANDDEAQKAIEMFNGSKLGERTITVNEARPREEGGGRRGPREDRGGYGARRDDRY